MNGTVDIIKEFANAFGLDFSSLWQTSLLVIGITAALKKYVVWLQGKRILIASSILSIAFCWSAYRTDFLQAVVAAIFVFVLSLTQWEVAKGLAHKIGSPKKN